MSKVKPDKVKFVFFITNITYRIDWWRDWCKIREAVMRQAGAGEGERVAISKAAPPGWCTGVTLHQGGGVLRHWEGLHQGCTAPEVRCCTSARLYQGGAGLGRIQWGQCCRRGSSRATCATAGARWVQTLQEATSAKCKLQTHIASNLFEKIYGLVHCFACLSVDVMPRGSAREPAVDTKIIKMGSYCWP